MKKIISIMLALAMIFAMSAFVFASNSFEEDIISIKLNPKADINAISAVLEENNFSILEFDAVVIGMHGEPITVGYVVNDQELFVSLWEAFLDEQRELVKESIFVNNKNEDILQDSQLILKAINDESIFINRLVCLSSKSFDYRSLLSNDCIQYVIVQEREKEAKHIHKNEPKSMNQENWVPTSGTAYAFASGSYTDATYLQVDYRWSSSAAMTTLTNNYASTIEGDLVLYNYDGSAISTAWKTNYAYVTNQPQAYRDTQVADNSNEPNFSIGCSYAYALSSGTTYYWYAYGNKTTSPSCKAKLVFQRGERGDQNLFGYEWDVIGLEARKVISFSEWDTAYSSSKSFIY